MPIFRDPRAVETVLVRMEQRVAAEYGSVDVVIGLEARGFLLAPMLALRLGAAFVPVRKAGKLPGELVRTTYEKEYGADVFEMQRGSIAAGRRCIVVDDLLATGGTLRAACELAAAQGGRVLECLVLIELTDLAGRATLPATVFSLLQF